MNLPLSRVFPLLLLILILPLTINAQTYWQQPYHEAVIVSTEQLATEAGIEILKSGGNAVDAAVAVQFALAVSVPRAGNIGGGGFMVIRLNNGTATTLDFREKAPSRATRNMYMDPDGNYIQDLSREGHLSIGVPGTVDGMTQALQRYGRFPLDAVLEPAIRLARDGFPLTSKLAEELNSGARTFAKYEASAGYFIRADGREWREGDLFVQTDLATTLERIARFGRDGFYTGPIALAMVRELNRNGGIISTADLRNYRSVWRSPLTTTYKDYTLYMMPPPSSGGIVVEQVLGMIQDYDLKALGFNSADYAHLISEALRRSFADRAYYMGDSDFHPVPLDELASPVYLRSRMQTFRMDTVTSSSDLSHGDLSPFSESPETTHFSVIDKEGNAVAVTTTLNSSFGSFVSVPGAGFLLNNEMDDFSAKPGTANQFGLLGAEANSIEPDKRMLSAMSPVVVTKNNETRMVLGAAGGPRIITAVIQNFLNIAVFGMTPNQAISAYRFHHQWIPDRLTMEEFTFSTDTQRILETKGHTLHFMNAIGRSHILMVDDKGIRYGAPDPRGDGFTAGY